MLAPMAGVADAAFRNICRELGGNGPMFTEMVSAKGLCFGDAKSFELACFSDAERPIGIQLFGGDPDIVARAIELISGYNADFIDINMGCPMPKITKNGEGSALMLDPMRAQAVVRAAVGAASGKPVSVKIRKGWDSERVNAVEFAKQLEASGAAMITVHGRTRYQMYGGQADWNIIADVKQAVGIPVVGNGDVSCPDEAIRMFRETSCDSVMIGRAARGKPWLLKDAGDAVAQWCGSMGRAAPTSGACITVECGEAPEGALDGAPTSEPDSAPASVPDGALRIDVMKRHLELAVQMNGERKGILEMRKHLAWYIKGVKNAAALRNELFKLTGYNGILQCIENLNVKIL